MLLGSDGFYQRPPGDAASALVPGVRALMEAVDQAWASLPPEIAGRIPQSVNRYSFVALASRFDQPSGETVWVQGLKAPLKQAARAFHKLEANSWNEPVHLSQNLVEAITEDREFWEARHRKRTQYPPDTIVYILGAVERELRSARNPRTQKFRQALSVHNLRAAAEFVRKEPQLVGKMVGHLFSPIYKAIQLFHSFHPMHHSSKHDQETLEAQMTKQGARSVMTPVDAARYLGTHNDALASLYKLAEQFHASKDEMKRLQSQVQHTADSFASLLGLSQELRPYALQVFTLAAIDSIDAPASAKLYFLTDKLLQGIDRPTRILINTQAKQYVKHWKTLSATSRFASAVADLVSLASTLTNLFGSKVTGDLGSISVTFALPFALLAVSKRLTNLKQTTSKLPADHFDRVYHIHTLSARATRASAAYHAALRGVSPSDVESALQSKAAARRR